MRSRLLNCLPVVLIAYSGIFAESHLNTGGRSIAPGSESWETADVCSVDRPRQTPIVAPTPTPTPPPVTPVNPTPGTRNCVAGGCSGQLCVEEGEGDITTCEFRPEYACYGRHSTCARQSSGHCGWTQTPALATCLQNPPRN